MTRAESIDVTRLLKAWGGGDELALEQLVPVVYNELHRMAQRYMRRENPEASMQATALVHEAYLRLVNVTGIEWRDRAHFFAVAATMICQPARAYDRGSRGG